MDVGFRRGRVPAHWSVLALILALAGDPAGAQVAGLPPVDDPSDGQVEWYRDALGNLLPVPPSLLRDFNDRLRQHREAAADSRPAPQAIISEADIVSLEPGGMPPVVRLSPGIATVINFSDGTGQPWPVAGFVIGDREGFDVLHPAGVDGMQGPSHLAAAPLRSAGWTNLVVTLAGEATPVVLSLVIDRLKPHYRLDVQVMALGPNAAARPAPAARPPQPGSRQLLRFVAAADLPEGVQEAGIDNVLGTRVWVSPSTGDGRTMWVRTRHALLGPEWTEVLSGPNGVRVYRLPAASMLLFSVGGRTTMARVDLP